MQAALSPSVGRASDAGRSPESTQLFRSFCLSVSERVAPSASCGTMSHRLSPRTGLAVDERTINALGTETKPYPQFPTFCAVMAADGAGAARQPVPARGATPRTPPQRSVGRRAAGHRPARHSKPLSCGRYRDHRNGRKKGPPGSESCRHVAPVRLRPCRSSRSCRLHGRPAD